MELFFNLSVFTLWPRWAHLLAKPSFPEARFRIEGDIRYSTWVKTGLVDAIWIDHCVERAGMEVIALLFSLSLCCVVCGEWSLRTDWRFKVSCRHGDGFVSFMCLKVCVAR